MVDYTTQDIHKGGWLKPIIKHGKWYIFSSFFTKGLGIIMLPIFTRYLTPEDYGVLSSLNSVALLLPVFISLSLDSAFGRFFHDWKHNQEKLKKLFSTIFWFIMLYGNFVIMLMLVTSKFWMKDLLKVDVYPYAYLAFIPPLFIQLGILGLIFLRQSLKARTTTIIQLLSALIGIIVSIPLLIPSIMGFDLGVIARLWGSVASAVFLFIFYTIYFCRIGLLRFTFEKKILRMCLVYSVPLIPTVASWWIASVSDRLIIAKYVDMSAVGLYSLGYQAAHLLYVLGDAITQVISPVTMSGLIHDKERTKKKMADYSLFLWAFMLLANLGLFLFAKEIVTLLADKAYKESFRIIPIISFIYVLSMQHRFFANVISFHKKTWIISTGGIISAITNLGFNILFVPKYGYIAAAYATIFSMLIMSLWELYWCQKLDTIKFFWKKMGIILFIYFISTSFGYTIVSTKELSILNILIKMTIVLISGLLFILIIDRNLVIKVLQHANKKRDRYIKDQSRPK